MMTHADMIRAFGFDLALDQIPQTIYPYAPVYRLRYAERDWIVKRTQKPLARGQAVAAWAHAVAAQGIQLVVAAQGFGENPRAFRTQEGIDEVWVVYPFIAGNPYKGNSTQIMAAGSLLGKMHALQSQESFGLKTSETVVAVEPAEIEEDIEGILEFVQNRFPKIAVGIKDSLAERTRKYFQDSLPRMLQTRLPLSVCSWDFKASNLIYVRDDSPVLVDIDNAGCIPRLYDLAIAALLFHNEGQGSSRLFTPKEWSAFLHGYAQHAQLTDEERQAWEDVLLCAWMDEGLWLLRDDQAGWDDPQQSQLLLSLLSADLSSFALLGNE